MTSCTGSVDRVYERTVLGWAWDAGQPEARLRVWIRVNGTLAGATMADRLRADLIAAGIGDGLHAFAFHVPERVGEIDSVEVVLKNGRRLPQEPPGGLLVPATTPPTKDTCGPGPAAGRATSLDDYLGRHPDVCMSEPNDPCFFEAEHDRGAAYYRDRSLAHWGREAHVGESRHRNLYLPPIAPLIHAHIPNARLVAILRDP